MFELGCPIYYYFNDKSTSDKHQQTESVVVLLTPVHLCWQHLE